MGGISYSRQQRTWKSQLSRFDFFPKTSDDVRQRSTTGSFVTILVSVAIVTLISSETMLWWRVELVSHMAVDSVVEERVALKVDLSFPGMSCEGLEMDVVDTNGHEHNGVDHNMQKFLEVDGEVKQEEEGDSKAATAAECLPCYGAQRFKGDCCPTCKDVVERYAERGWALPEDVISQCRGLSSSSLSDAKSNGETIHRGCRVQGTIEVDKVAGNLHFALGTGVPGTAAGATMYRNPIDMLSYGKIGAQHTHNFNFSQLRKFNSSHVIHEFNIGDHTPLTTNALRGQSREVDSGVASYNYYIWLVPTVFTRLDGMRIETYQVTFTEKIKAVDKHASSFPHPGVFFFYEFSPLVMIIEERREPFSSLITRMCAVVGGMFAVAGLLAEVLKGAVLRWIPTANQAGYVPKVS